MSRRQLLDHGISSHGIAHRLSAGRLHRVHPGVYAVGHPLLSQRGWWMAAVLCGGLGALLSHAAAAALWGLVRNAPAVSDVLMRRSPTRRPGIRGHRVRRIPPAHRSAFDGIPCTSVSRTLLDLATVAGERALDRAVRSAVDRRLYDRFAMDEVLASGRPGSAALRVAVAAIVHDERADVRTKSELELRFLELLREGGFVAPRTNVIVSTPWGSYEVDAFWPERGLVVELDGWATHHDREAFRRDHRRDADLAANGHPVLRLSWEQVVDRPSETVARLERLVPRQETPEADRGAP